MARTINAILKKAKSDPDTLAEEVKSLEIKVEDKDHRIAEAVHKMHTANKNCDILNMTNNRNGTQIENLELQLKDMTEAFLQSPKESFVQAQRDQLVVLQDEIDRLKAEEAVHLDRADALQNEIDIQKNYACTLSLKAEKFERRYEEQRGLVDKLQHKLVVERDRGGDLLSDRSEAEAARAAALHYQAETYKKNEALQEKLDDLTEEHEELLEMSGDWKENGHKLVKWTAIGWTLAVNGIIGLIVSIYFNIQH